MPCSDSNYGFDTAQEQEIQRLTRLLCSTCKLLEAKGFPMPTLEIERWWANHKKEDERRLAREQAEREKNRLRKQAIAKLTTQERKALGL